MKKQSTVRAGRNHTRKVKTNGGTKYVKVKGSKTHWRKSK